MDLPIDVQGLSKSYGSLHALRGVDLQVRRGEIFGLLGPNGAGKTTTVEVLEGFRQRDSGSVRVLGHDPASAEGRAMIHRLVGVVLQDTGHYRFLTVGETLEMYAAYYDAPRAPAEVLELVGLQDCAKMRVGWLSGGQRRRLDVGVALVGRPQLVFLDEPTTGFDPAARRKAWTTIAALRDLGTTVLLTTHYMEEAQVLCDRVGVMRDGHIAAVGTPAELASQLRLRSRLSFALPGDVPVSELPDAIAAALRPDGRVELDCDEPTRVLAEVCGWAAGRGIELEDLQLRAPSLEESYLTLTDDATSATRVLALSGGRL